ncbi:MAG: DUF1499 domain-containing protein [Halieaceae bacterium]
MRVYRIVYPLIVVCLAGCTSAPDQPTSGAALPDCGTFPNCVNSELSEGGKAIAPMEATSQQWQELKQWIAAQKDWTITIDTGDFMQAIVKTPLIRFQDDVQLRFIEGKNVIHVRSSSRLGIGDMGTNRRRVEMLRGQLHVH